MATGTVLNETGKGNTNLTDPREAYEAMSRLAKETESELDRIHEELVVLTEGFRIMTWHEDECCEFNPDAWHRLMFRTVAQVEVLRARVEDEAILHRLRPTEEEQAASATKDKAVDTLLAGVRAIVADDPQAAQAYEAADRLSATA